MGIFKKFLGKEKEFGDFVVKEKSDYVNFDDLLEQNAGLSFEKQLLLSNVIGENSWNLDMDRGVISFGDFGELEFSIQIIGSLSFSDNSWMWAWANTKSNIPENLLIQSNKLKDIGEKKNIKELKDGHFFVEEGFEHKVAMIASGLFNSKAYYCADYGQGTLVVTIDDEQIPNVDKNELATALTLFPNLIQNVELNNHKKAFLNYLIDREFKLKISDNKIEGLRNNKTIIAEFDELDRIKSLNGKL